MILGKTENFILLNNFGMSDKLQIEIFCCIMLHLCSFGFEEFLNCLFCIRIQTKGKYP